MTQRVARRLVAGVLGLALWLGAIPARAVVVELKNGQRVEGALRQASAARVILETNGQVLVFETRDIQAIYFATPPPAPPATPAAIPAPVSPRSPSPIEVYVLEVVKALRATVAAGITSREYGPAVGEARVAVDRYLASSPFGLPPGGEALRDAVRYYQMAEFAWRNHSIASHTVWLQREDLLDRCHGYQDFVEAMQAKGESHYSERTRNFVLISDGVLAVLWSCAADRIADAEQAFPKRDRK